MRIFLPIIKSLRGFGLFIEIDYLNSPDHFLSNLLVAIADFFASFRSAAHSFVAFSEPVIRKLVIVNKELIAMHILLL